MTTGTRVQIKATTNEFARDSIGLVGTIVDKAPLGMVVVHLDNGTYYSAYPHNLAKVR